MALRIARGILHPNEHLVELAIAEEFKTSRAPVREALLMLEKDKLVQKVPHRGFVVKKFSKDEIHQLYDATFRLEEIAIQKAITNATQDDIERLEQILLDQESAIDNEDIVDFYELNEDFHAQILAIANNQFITDMHQSLRRSSRPLSFLNMGQGKNMLLSYQEHTKQFEAIKNKDVAAGVNAIREQEERSLKTLDIFYAI
nr:GntR family transcriptional regulator [Alicyclobacillus fastidiosus]